MEWLIIILLLAILALLAYLLWNRRTPQDTQAMVLLQQRIQELEKSIESKLGEGTNRMFENMRSQFGESQKLAADIRDLVSKQLTEVKIEQTKTNESTTRFMVIAEQLANLEKVLKHQKQRGNLGEASLELILSNILPPGQYKMQYEFPGGDTVDAVIYTKEGVIPIDAKFSLDNYQRL
ncbi:MAG: DNA recombination protein RmuC, partial [bacterium]|nr:DNA recombination protein RmuC [bacterium]